MSIHNEFFYKKIRKFIKEFNKKINENQFIKSIRSGFV